MGIEVGRQECLRVAPGRVASEDDPPVPVSETYPRASEAAANALKTRGVRVMGSRFMVSVSGWPLASGDVP
jgi:hypothetical protein